MKVCRACGRAKPDASFLAGKAKPRVSSTCSPCRRKAAAAHRRAYYAALPADKSHELTHKRRAAGYGVTHVAYSRTAILARWNGMCAYCDSRAEHMDHVHPLSRGGDDIESNMLPACAKCNLSKGAKSLAEWAETFGPVAPRCAHCGLEVEDRGDPSMDGNHWVHWVHVPGGYATCFPQKQSNSPRAEPLA
jgi:hypothetical protein